MKVPLAWLATYVPLNLPPAEIAHRLTMAGIETIYEPGASAGWDRVVVGRVVKLEAHPNADRLQLATVDIGNEAPTVVCGAPNIEQGQHVAFAQVGARLVDSGGGSHFTLEAATIRGVTSAGMVCSERELGMGESHDGILVLPEVAAIGQPLADYFQDAVLDVEVTSNRPDCLSLLGIAHELAAATGTQVTAPALDYASDGPAISESLKVVIENPELCSRYLATVVRGVKVGPSPQWMQARLVAAGLHPINNVVDVTNYVMLEYGQPLHAFDLQNVRQGTIVVRAAREKEKFTTLDGEEYELQPPMLLIADPERGIALAGIMGGANSEMAKATTDVLLESATFNGINTRRTTQRLKLRTEASTRFEKTLNPEMAMRALQRATGLILETAGGTADQSVAEAFPGTREIPPVAMRRQRLQDLMGAEFSYDQITQVLEALGFALEPEPGSDPKDPEVVLATPPYWRSDVSIEEDVIEEVVRILGYDSVQGEPLSGRLPNYEPNPTRDIRERIKDLLVTCGLQETISYSLVSATVLAEAESPIKSEGAPLRLANPMSREQEYLRTTFRSSVLHKLSSGLRLPPNRLGVFEAGSVYLPRLEDLPEERQVIFSAMAGPRGDSLWNKGAEPLDFFDAKGIVLEMMDHLGLETTVERGDDPMFHPGRSAHIKVHGRTVGTLGELHPSAVVRFGLPVKPIACFEIDLDALLDEMPALRYHYQPFTRFPSADRDLALVVDEHVSAEHLRSILKEHPLVRRAVLFDLFSGDPLPQGKKSLAYRLELQSDSGTLSPEQLNETIQSLVGELEAQTGAILRV
jgi:phenylalanyl-tRNA synthetase beta chain